MTPDASAERYVAQTLDVSREDEYYALLMQCGYEATDVPSLARWLRDADVRWLAATERDLPQRVAYAEAGR